MQGGNNLPIMEYISNSLEDTMSFAEKMAKKTKPGDIICLSGSLGAGKTSFAKGFARGLGIKGHVNSPTFTLMQVYEDGTLPMYHFDLYRLAESFAEGEQIDFDTLDEIGFFDYLNESGVCLLEWAEYAKDLIPKNAIWVKIDVHGDTRKIFIEGSVK